MASKTHFAFGLIDPQTLGSFEVPTRSPGEDEVSIKVDFASYSAFDGHQVDENRSVAAYPHMIGSVAAGEVVEVGSKVKAIRKGDLVGAPVIFEGNRAAQQYVTVPSNGVTKIPHNIKPEQFVSVPDNLLTAWCAISNSLQLPLPNTVPSLELPPQTSDSPVLVSGAGTSVGRYAIQLLKLAGYTNIIATASSRSASRALEYGATHVFDYNDSDVSEKIKSLAEKSGWTIKHAVVCVASTGNLDQVAKVVTEPGSKVAAILAYKIGDVKSVNGGGYQFAWELPAEHNHFAPGVNLISTATMRWQPDPVLKENLWTNIVPWLLETGRIKPQDIRLISEGSLLERVQTAAQLVKEDKLGGAKAIIDLRS